VIDGFARRPEPERAEAAALELQRDEAIRVRSKDGAELLEVFDTDHGPVVRLLSEDVELDLPGKLAVRAEAITLESKKGQTRIEASDDVIVKGEAVHLN